MITAYTQQMPEPPTASRRRSDWLIPCLSRNALPGPARSLPTPTRPTSGAIEDAVGREQPYDAAIVVIPDTKSIHMAARVAGVGLITHRPSPVTVTRSAARTR